MLFAFPAAGALGFVLHEKVGLSEVALFIVIAMVYVTLARGRLIGSSVMIHESQYPRVFAIVKRTCAALEIPMPLIFAREDNNVPVAALGFGEPYALILSSHWIEHFADDELAFIVGRQLGHIAAGHTRYLSLLSINGNENPIISLIFGGWLRTCEFTCDKIGLLVCGSLDAASRAIAISSFHTFGRSIDLQQFAGQGREISTDSVLRFGEWLGSEPYATRRIAAMDIFSRTQLFQECEQWFLRGVSEPPALPAPGAVHVQRGDCAGWWRRFTAVTIDLIIVSALLGAFVNNAPPDLTATTAAAKPAKNAASDNAEKVVIYGVNLETGDVDAKAATPFYRATQGIATYLNEGRSPLAVTLRGLARYLGIGLGKGAGTPYWLAALYFILLVSLTGQTFGMMIVGLRVVGCDFRPPGLGRTVWRYVLTLFLWPLILAASVVQHRIMLHDRWSRTRLITAERAMARVLTVPTPP